MPGAQRKDYVGLGVSAAALFLVVLGLVVVTDQNPGFLLIPLSYGAAGLIGLRIKYSSQGRE